MITLNIFVMRVGTFYGDENGYIEVLRDTEVMFGAQYTQLVDGGNSGNNIVVGQAKGNYKIVEVPIVESIAIGSFKAPNPISSIGI